MPTLSELFNLDPKVERLALMPRMRGSLGSDYGVSPEMQNSVMFEGKKGFMPDVIAPKVLYDFIRAIKAPGRAARGEVLDEEEALNTALNMFGGGLATSGSVPIGALGMSARTAPAGTVPLREIPRSPLGFYSKVEEATLPLQNKGSGGQFLAQIQKTPGVKPEEIEVLGLDKFLQSKPTVTKQEVQDYITANKPDVQEVRLGDASAYGLDEMWKGAEAARTKFGKYTIPGGENYRELLLTLPQKVEKGFMTPNGAFFSEADLADPIVRSTAEKIGLSPAFRNVGDAYRSSHYDQPNILTHLRANDRVIDGKKALFIEEIQSDWHQAGRKKGYDTPEARAAEQQKLDNILAERQQLLTEQRRLEELALPYTNQGRDAPSEIVDQWSIVSNRINNLQVEQNRLGRGFGQQVPDAPFKKSWHELALKRAIQEAVDKGYDKLAFTTGKTQAERYNLSKHIDEINVTGRTNALTGEKSKSVALDTVDGQSIRFGVAANGLVDNVNDQAMSHLIGKSLDEVVGKELAKNIMEGGSQTISGKGLEVGGEGQKGFYDEILPKALQNLTKKYGTKVTKSKLDEGSEVWSMDITPQMREQIASKGQPLFATAPPLGLASQDPLEQFLGYQEAENDPMMQFLGQK